MLSRAMYGSLFSCLALLSLILLTGCQSNSAEEIDLSGNWLVIKAFRNNRPTSTLEDGYFYFDSDSTFHTNIFGSNEMHYYRQTGDGFEQIGPNSVRYSIKENSGDTLVLDSKIMSYDFSFVLVSDTSSIDIHNIMHEH